MTPTLLSGPDQKEGLSVAYVKALAARAGFATSVPEQDRDSVDLRIMAGGPQRPALDLQLKATAELADMQDGYRRCRLRIKNHDDPHSRGQPVQHRDAPKPHGAVAQRGHLMRINLRERGALLAVSPAALSAYARAAGWRRARYLSRALGRLRR